MGTSSFVAIGALQVLHIAKRMPSTLHQFKKKQTDSSKMDPKWPVSGPWKLRTDPDSEEQPDALTIQDERNTEIEETERDNDDFGASATFFSPWMKQQQVRDVNRQHR